MHGLLRCNIKTGVHARVQSGRVTQRCHNSSEGKRRLVSANDVTHWKRTVYFGRFWKSQWVENWRPNEMVDFRLLAETFVAGATRVGGCRWKNQNRKIVPLLPYVEEPLNSKVIKGFVPEQRSRQVFFEFRDSHVLSFWTFDVRFTHSCIWLWYIFKEITTGSNYSFQTSKSPAILSDRLLV